MRNGEVSHEASQNADPDNSDEYIRYKCATSAPDCLNRAENAKISTYEGVPRSPPGSRGPFFELDDARAQPGVSRDVTTSLYIGCVSNSLPDDITI